MKNKRKFIYTFSKLFAIAMVIGLASCDEEQPEPLVFDPDLSSSTTQVGEAIVFTDYSTGVESRNWTFPGGTPASSTEGEVSVTWAAEGPYTASIEVAFTDGTRDKKDFPIQVGSEKYSRFVFGFEVDTMVEKSWATWSTSSSNGNTWDGLANFEIDATQGANGTAKSAKITVLSAGDELQMFSVNKNAVLESNKTYEFSLWVKGTSGITITGVELTNQLILEDVTVQDWHNYAWISPVALTDTWTKHSYTVETGDISEYYSEGKANNAYTLIKFTPESNGEVYIDEISLKEVQ
ncbi:MAG: hypothetical protein ACP5E3_08055 [Bacteroidales bacterium]